MFQNEDLRELDQKFLVIPPQVFTVEVSGLQDFGESDTLLKLTIAILLKFLIITSSKSKQGNSIYYF